MTRIFFPPEELSSNIVSITGDQARHLALVLRAKPSDMISIPDGNGYEYECRIVSVHKKEIKAEVINKVPYSAESPISITLAQGISKGERMDIAIQKSTELGAVRIVPVVTKRTQARQTDKTERWRKIALSAAQQSGRDRVPEIDESIQLEEFLASMTPGFSGIIFFEENRERDLKKVLSDLKGIKELTILIGPEGGFTKEEVASAKAKGFIETSLGPRILRTETAPITALSIIQYELGDMG